MKLSLLIVLIIALTGCHEGAKSRKTARQLGCDNLREQKVEDQQSITEACFYRGTFKKSTSKGW